MQSETQMLWAVEEEWRPCDKNTPANEGIAIGNMFIMVFIIESPEVWLA